MQFFKAASLFSIFFLALVGLVAAGPVATKRTANSTVDVSAEIIAALKALEVSIATPLLTIAADAKVAADVNITAEIEPLVLEVIADLDVAIKTIVAIEVGLNATVSISAAEKQEIANLVAEIVGGIVLSLEQLGSEKAALIKTLISKLDKDIDSLLEALEKLVAGLLKLVAKLLVTLVSALKQLGLTLTIKDLGF